MGIKQLLPDRIAVLVPNDQDTSEIVLPEATHTKWYVSLRPGRRLLRGTVAAVGRQRGRFVPPPVGETVYVEGHAGLTIEHLDTDTSIDVPEGFTLRLYGVGDHWIESVHVAA